MKSKGLNTLLICFLLLCATACGAAATYTVAEIGTFGGPGSYPTSINNLGQVTGNGDITATWAPGYYYAHGFIWERGIVTELDTLGEMGSYAYGINDSGAVAGLVYTYNGGRQSFVRQGDMTTLIPLSAAMSINNSGTVVGTCEAGGNVHAAVWSSGILTDLGTFGGAGSIARDVNDSGLVVGMAYDADSLPHAFLWDGTDMRDLGVGEAYAINNLGQIIGPGFLWQNGITTILPHFSPYAINDLGHMVGYSQSATGAKYVALWENGVITNLSELIRTTTPYRLDALMEPKYGINNSGQIVAVGYILGQGRHALVLTPIPEPSSLASLSLALLAAGAGVRWRMRG